MVMPMLFVCLFFAELCGLWNLPSSTRDCKQATEVHSESMSPNGWRPREFPLCCFLCFSVPWSYSKTYFLIFWNIGHSDYSLLFIVAVTYNIYIFSLCAYIRYRAWSSLDHCSDVYLGCNLFQRLLLLVHYYLKGYLLCIIIFSLKWWQSSSDLLIGAVGFDFHFLFPWDHQNHRSVP